MFGISSRLAQSTVIVTAVSELLCLNQSAELWLAELALDAP